VHKSYVLSQSRERTERDKKEKDKLVKKFLDKNKEKIKKLLKRVESSLSFSDIEKHCYHFNVVLFMPIKRLIITNKRNDLLRKEQYRQSAYTKHSWGVRNNYSNIPEIMKEKIRAEYMLNAKKIVDKKMKELCQNL